MGELGRMRTVWKFELSKLSGNEVIVTMPKGAEILCVGTQDHRSIMLWALVDPESEKEDRRFAVFGTGHPIFDTNLKYLGTAQWANDPDPRMAVFLVWHVFEVVE